MSSLVVCPRCASQLGAPDEGDWPKWAACPVCDAQFAVRRDAIRQLPAIRAVEGPPPAAPQARTPEAPTITPEPSREPPQLAPELASAKTISETTSPTSLEQLLAQFSRDRAADTAAGAPSEPQAADDRTAAGAGERTTTRASDQTVEFEPSAWEEAAGEGSPGPALDVGSPAGEPDSSAIRAFAGGPPERFGSDDAGGDGGPGEAFEPSPSGVSTDEYAGDSGWSPGHWGAPKRLAKGLAVALPVCLMLGYVSLWMGGAQTDYLHLASVLPEALLPAGIAPKSTASSAASSGASSPEAAGSLTISEATETQVDGPAGDPNPRDSDRGAAGVIVDTEVSAATAIVAEGTARAALPKPWPVTPLVGLLENPQLNTLEELSQATLQGEQAAEEFLAGELVDPESISRKGQGYVGLCRLAQALTLLEPMDLGPLVVQRQAAGSELLRSSTLPPSNRQALAQIASRWWEYQERPVPGIFFVSTVRDLRAVGRWTEYAMEIAWDGGSVTVPVLMEKMGLSTGDERAVIGVVVNDPRRQLLGYDRDVSQLVLAGYALPLKLPVGAGHSRRTIDRVTRDLLSTD